MVRTVTKFVGKFDVEMGATLWKKIDIFKNTSQCQSGVSIVGTVMNRKDKKREDVTPVVGS